VCTHAKPAALATTRRVGKSVQLASPNSPTNSPSERRAQRERRSGRQLPARLAGTDIGDISATRFAELAAHLHRLGPRPTFELLKELASADVVARLERYAKLDPDIVAEIGADRMPTAPVTLVASS
jgi:hypothetical protein